jgi:hypothetical protein
MIKNFFLPIRCSNAIPIKKKINIFPRICKNPLWTNIDVRIVYIWGKSSGERYADLNPNSPIISSEKKIVRKNTRKFAMMIA